MCFSGANEGDSDEAKAGPSVPSDPISKYRALLLNIEEEEEKKKNRGVEMEVTWGVGQKGKSQKLVKQKMKEGVARELTPFQQMMEKGKEKKRLKREAREKKRLGQVGATSRIKFMIVLRRHA